MPLPWVGKKFEGFGGVQDAVNFLRNLLSMTSTLCILLKLYYHQLPSLGVTNKLRYVGGGF